MVAETREKVKEAAAEAAAQEQLEKYKKIQAKT